MITFQVERLAPIQPELEHLLKLHWEEVALNRDTIPLEPDWDMYYHLDGAGMLHILTARSAGKLIGYYIDIIKGHLHYKSSKTAFCDVYYLMPKHRTGRTALRLFMEHERALNRIGVNKIYTMHKVHVNNIGPLLAKLGYKHIENVLTKVLEA